MRYLHTIFTAKQNGQSVRSIYIYLFGRVLINQAARDAGSDYIQ